MHLEINNTTLNYHFLQSNSPNNHQIFLPSGLHQLHKTFIKDQSEMVISSNLILISHPQKETLTNKATLRRRLRDLVKSKATSNRI